MADKITQGKKLLSHLEKVGPISTLQTIVMYNIVRPAAVVKELRDAGWPIETTIVWKKQEDGSTTHYAIYSLRKEAS